MPRTMLDTNPEPHDSTAQVGEIHTLPVSRAQRVWMDRAARALESGDPSAMKDAARAARELRTLSEAWRLSSGIYHNNDQSEAAS